ncbi:uncharacterized protein BO97DRAFT_5577 [Aspergillus homomorphus CBS 101889]|uniref:Uncharacterized protein n=1 Tax=Aspergillus homomorphus (strain CBS 101889) TaxID=1450537 RepID=A0A395IGQ4_ASPHC|nr:hypothetical protein BO97DRAFT_5577 [Aspergillus homomorphus CBS 101889]RAL17374.1 hypothetical protein BO97DRAFT_5577 [Aspergillus homomorphus CBS 101889]
MLDLCIHSPLLINIDSSFFCMAACLRSANTLSSFRSDPPFSSRPPILPALALASWKLTPSITITTQPASLIGSYSCPCRTASMTHAAPDRGRTAPAGLLPGSSAPGRRFAPLTAQDRIPDILP